MSEIGVGVCLDEFIFGWVMIELMYNKREERRHWFMHSLRLSFSTYILAKNLDKDFEKPYSIISRVKDGNIS